MVGIGCDVETVKRFEEAAANERFLANVFTPEEIRYCLAGRRPALRYARIFACKEAAFKALASLGTAPCGMREIEILLRRRGHDTARVRRRGYARYRIFVDCADDDSDLVFATSVAETVRSQPR